MSISAASSTDSSSLIRQLLASLQSSASQALGVQDPEETSDPASTSGSQAPSTPLSPPPKPDDGGTNRFATDTLSSLLSAQSQSSPSSNIASTLLGNFDADSSGSLSLAEVTQALGGSSGSTSSSSSSSSSASSLSSAFSSIDSDGDGQLSQDELSTALQKQQDSQRAHGGGHHHHHRAYAAAQTSSTTATSPTTTSATATDAANADPLSTTAAPTNIAA